MGHPKTRNARRSWIALGVAAAVLAAGCAATPQASPDADDYAKRFLPQRGASVIYLYRDDRVGPQTAITMTIDGHLLGDLLPTTYYRMSGFPGHHVLAVTGQQQASVALETEAGKIYFVTMRTTQTENPIVTLLPVPPARGEADIRSCCDRLENWRRGQWRLPL